MIFTHTPSLLGNIFFISFLSHLFFSVIHLASSEDLPQTPKSQVAWHTVWLILSPVDAQGCHENPQHEKVFAGIFPKLSTAVGLCWHYSQEESDNSVRRTQLACLSSRWRGGKALSHWVITIYLILSLQRLLHFTQSLWKQKANC